MDPGPLIPTSGQMLREGQPISPADFQRQLAPHVHSALPAQESVLREYFRTLVKRRWVIVASLALIFGVVFIATLRATRIYDASGSIAINKPDPMTFNFKDSNGTGMGDYDSSDIETEVRILRSDLLALQVIKQLNLDQRPEFGGSGDRKSVV